MSLIRNPSLCRTGQVRFRSLELVPQSCHISGEIYVKLNSNGKNITIEIRRESNYCSGHKNKSTTQIPDSKVWYSGHGHDHECQLLKVWYLGIQYIRDLKIDLYGIWMVDECPIVDCSAIQITIWKTDKSNTWGQSFKVWVRVQNILM